MAQLVGAVSSGVDKNTSTLDVETLTSCFDVLWLRVL